MEEQTAVEWLQEQLQKGINYNPIEKNGYSNAEQKLFEQAKEIEKNQLQESYYAGYSDGMRDENENE
jgi:hypothetical protein